MREGGDSVEARVIFGFRLATGRRPTREESALIRSVYQSQLVRFRADKSAASKLLQVGQASQFSQLNMAEQAAWTSVTRMLLNLDETITKG
jgi:hypothetical protein